MKAEPLLDDDDLDDEFGGSEDETETGEAEKPRSPLPAAAPSLVDDTKYAKVSRRSTRPTPCEAANDPTVISERSTTATRPPTASAATARAA